MFEYLESLGIANLVSAIVVIIITIVLLLIVRSIFKKWQEREAAHKSSSLVVPVLWSILRVAILIIAVVTILGIYGVNIVSVVAGLGIAATIIGLALQDVLKDIIMGFHIMIDQFFAVGDAVIYNGELAVVEDFNLRTTKIRTIDNPGIISICNRKIDEIKLAGESNFIDVAVSYKAPDEQVAEVLSASCRKISDIQGIKKSFYAGTQALEESGVMHRVFVFCDPKAKYKFLREARKIIKADLDAAGIEIPTNKLFVGDEEVTIK